MPRLRTRDSLSIVQLLPNLVTIFGLGAGLTAIRFVFEGQFAIATALIVVAAVVDGLDGLVARRLRAISNFGAELDTLSDFVCFGVAPGVLVYQFAMSGAPGIGWVFVLVFVICCCLRLARFNVHRNAPPPAGREHFIGVPAPAGAMLALLPVFMTLAGLVDLRAQALPVAVYLALVGVLMISRLRTPSPKSLRIPRERARWVLIGGALVVGAIFASFWLLMVALTLVYAGILAWMFTLACRRIAARRRD